MPTLSTLPLEVKQLIAQHALALGRLAEVAPALARTPNDQRCISTLATLNSEWHRICRPILWEVSRALSHRQRPADPHNHSTFASTAVSASRCPSKPAMQFTSSINTTT